MELIHWLPAITVTGLFAAALWLGRALISTRLKASVQHEFNERLETLRMELRATEEKLKGQLREREAEISALRSGALAYMTKIRSLAAVFFFGSLIAACASNPLRIPQEKTVTVSGQVMKFSGTYNERNHYLTVTINGDTVMQGNFSTFNPTQNFNAKYKDI